jgi:type II secretory pathway pseudopilin PulG
MITRRARCQRAFTLVEFMVLFGIGLILLSIFIPYLLRLREDDRRTRCANNLREIGEALSKYADDNAHNLPRVVYDEKNMPTGYTAFTGPDDANPFAADSQVQSNDVTASLWLLLRTGYLTRTDVFICPGSTDTRDLLTNAAGLGVDPTQRSNFRRPSHLSYSYASPFSNALNFKLNSDFINSEFALVADKNPGVDEQADVTGPTADADPIALSRANSLHHGRAGQQVLYWFGRVDFKRTPYAGASYKQPSGDNIYTARTMRPATQPINVPVYVNGFCDRNLSPATPDDSYLVPTAQDGPSAPRPIAPATQPTTVPVAPPPATAPTTVPVAPATTSATTQP